MAMRTDRKAASAGGAALLTGAIGVAAGGWAGSMLGTPAVAALSAVMVAAAVGLARRIASGALVEADARTQAPSIRTGAQGSVEALVSALDPPLVLLDTQGAIRALSDSAQALLDLPAPLTHLDQWPRTHSLRPSDPGLPPDRSLEWLRRALRGEWSGMVTLDLRSPDLPSGRTLHVNVSRGTVDETGDTLVLLLLSDATEEERTRARLREHEARRLLRDTIMADVNAGMAIDQVIEHAIARIHVAFPELRVSYATVDERARSRVLHCQGPESLPSIRDLELDLTQIPDYLEALMTREALVIEDTRHDATLNGFSHAGADAATRALVDVPLRHSETLRAVLRLHAAEPRKWSDHEVASLRTAADCLSVALGDAHRQEERVRTREKMRHAARHDRLTGLPNRAHLVARLEQVIRRRAQRPEQRFALLFLDLDHFQVVNDGLGHEAGDQLLISLGERLRTFASECTPSSAGTRPLPARLGGDEFVLLVEGLRGSEEAERLAEELQLWLARPHVVGDREVIATASIGIVVDDGTYDSPDRLLRDADNAMYGAKRAGKARHAVFDDRMHSAAIARLQLERDLRRAVEGGQFIAHYQPVVDLRQLRLAGFESLMRWNHPDTGLVPPNDFIPLAEELGLIEPMGEWILRESARQLARWQDELGIRDLVMHVNVSRRQLIQPDFTDIVAGILEETRISPSLLKLEVTESTVMSAPHEISAVLRRLREQGLPLCMDDFGTGQSSLGALLSFPVDVLKIDRSFVRNIEGRREYAAVTEAIVTLAHSLGMSVVAEGVEKRADLEIIRELQCDQAQGFLFSRPLSPSAAEAYLRTCMAHGGRLTLPDEA